MEKIFNFLFKKKTLSERFREWKRSVRFERYKIERSIREIKRNEVDIIKSIKSSAKQKEFQSVIIYTKSLIHNRVIEKDLVMTKTILFSLESKINQRICDIKIIKCIEKSSEIMKWMNNVMEMDGEKLKGSMKKLKKEMSKYGVIENMIDENLEMIEKDDEDEEDGEEEEIDDEEVKNVLNEILEDVEDEKIEKMLKKLNVGNEKIEIKKVVIDHHSENEEKKIIDNSDDRVLEKV